MSETIELSARDPGLDALVRIARGGARVELSAPTLQRVATGFERLEEIAEQELPVYGLTTGCGALDAVSIDAADRTEHQLDIWRTHAVGVGEPMTAEETRGMTACRLLSLLHGTSAASPALVQSLVDLLNSDIVPFVPRLGSIGASDLAPLAHLGRVLAGEGKARLTAGEWLPANAALEARGLQPLCPVGRDGLALINGLAGSVSTASLAVHDLQHLLRVWELAVSGVLWVLDSPTDFLDSRLTGARGHPGAEASSAAMRRHLGLEDEMPRRRELPLREPLSTRYAPQLAGVLRESLQRADRVLSRERAAAVDNPYFHADGWFTSNSPNSDGSFVAAVADDLLRAIIPLAATSERCIGRILNPPPNSGLPAFLAQNAHSTGMMVMQYTAVALVARLQSSATPVVGLGANVSAGTEDWASHCGLAAERLREAVDSLARVLALELLVVCRAMELRGRAHEPAALGKLRETVATTIAAESSAELNGRVEALTQALRDHRLAI